MDPNYLSPRMLGEAIGVSQSSLKRWADRGLLEVERTAGGHRRITIREAQRFIRHAGLQVVKPELLGLSEESVVDLEGDDSTSVRDRFCRALQEGNDNAARELVLSLFARGSALPQLFDQIFQPALALIGELWLDDPQGIAIEHRAVDLCIQILGDLRGRLDPVTDGPVAIGAAPSADPYLLPSSMIAHALYAEGVRAINLGPNFPVSRLAAAAAREGAQFIWLSVTHSGRLDELREEILSLLDQLTAADIPLLLGGASSTKLRLPSHPLLSMGETVADVLAYARELFGSDRG